MSENAAYGTGFYKAVSADLQDIFPDVHSFSLTNLKYMRYFYEMYSIPENRQQVVDDSDRRQSGFSKQLLEPFCFEFQTSSSTTAENAKDSQKERDFLPLS